MSRQEVEHLQATLEEASAQADIERVATGALGIVVGSGLIGYGAYALIDNGDVSDRGERFYGPAFLMLVGGAPLVAGILSIVDEPSLAPERLRRFEALSRTGQLDRTALIRFETELRVEADLARKRRIWSAVPAIGSAATGAALAVAGAVSAFDEEDDNRAAFWIGLAVGGLSTVGALSGLLTVSREEARYRDYVAGKRPADRSAKLMKASVTWTGTGLAGRF